MESILQIISRNIEILPTMILLFGALYIFILKPLRKDIDGMGNRLSKDIETLKTNHFKHVENDHINISGKLDTIIEELKASNKDK